MRLLLLHRRSAPFASLSYGFCLAAYSPLYAFALLFACDRRRYFKVETDLDTALKNIFKRYNTTLVFKKL